MPKLRKYQTEDVNFLVRRNSAACFNEQRTGKTPIALTVVQLRECPKTLIVCPKSAIPQWLDEWNRWLPGVPCIIAAGTPKQKKEIICQWTRGLIVSYDSLKIVTKNNKSYGLAHDVLHEHPEFVIIDEAHRIRGRTTATAKAVKLFANAKYKLALTGTPAPGKPSDVIPLIQWLFPKAFPSYWKTVEYFFKITKNFANGNAYLEITEYLPGKDIEMINLLKEFSTQRKRKEVMDWISKDSIHIKVKLPLTKEQTRYIKELVHHFETEHVITQGILDRLIRYRQICLHPKILNLKGESPKLNWIKDYLDDYPDQSVIIFSKFTSFLNIAAAELEKYNIRLIIGKTPIKERKQIVKEFQSGRVKILLLNIDAGKEALTLDRAEVCIFTDKFPPVGDIQQAEARFVSSTKDKADKPHTIYELIMSDSYDEDIYELIRKNASLTDIINDYKKHLEKGGE